MNLYLDTVPYTKNDTIGPKAQGIRARKRSYLVFADFDPMANFGHRCRYMFYHEKTHSYLYSVDAQFPPHLYSEPHTYRVIDKPVRPHHHVPRAALVVTPRPAPPAAPAAAPVARKRYAILFSGSADRWHLNDLDTATGC